MHRIAAVGAPSRDMGTKYLVPLLVGTWLKPQMSTKHSILAV